MQLVLFSPSQLEPPRSGARVHDWVFDLPALASWWQGEFRRVAPIPQLHAPSAYPAPVSGLPVPPEAYHDLLTLVRTGATALQGAALLLSHALAFAGRPAPGPDGPPLQYAPSPIREAVHRVAAVHLHSVLPIDLGDLTSLAPLPGPDTPRLAVVLVAGKGAGVHALFGYSLLAVARGESGLQAILGPALLTRDEVPDPVRLTVDVRYADGTTERHQPFAAVAPWDLLMGGAPPAPGRILVVPLPAPATSVSAGDSITLSAPGFGTFTVLGQAKGITSPIVEAVDVWSHPAGLPGVPPGGRRLASVGAGAARLWRWLPRMLWRRNRASRC